VRGSRVGAADRASDSVGALTHFAETGDRRLAA
jgi:hypothetical protein